MSGLTDLERAILKFIADHAGDNTHALHEQIDSAQVVSRRNTGHGFYTTLVVDDAAAPVNASSPIGDVGAEVEGIPHGMGFLLWVRDGRLYELEGYVYEGSIEGRDLTALHFTKVGHRLS